MTLRKPLALACAVASLALAAPGGARAETEWDRAQQVGRAGFDLVILRPLGVVLTAVSLAGAAVAYPVAWPFGGEDHVVDYLVKDPIDRTFRRPLGEL